MKIGIKEIKELLIQLGFAQFPSMDDVLYKEYDKHDNYLVKVNFKDKKIEYGSKISKGDETTSDFSNSENFVVLECIDRLLEIGYSPESLFLEYKWPLGRKEKGKLDILVLDKSGNAYLMIECKTWGVEYDKESKKMIKDGGQLFSYYLQDKSAKYLCLYSSRLYQDNLEYKNNIIKSDDAWISLTNQKEIHSHWNKNFKENGIFDDWAKPYDIEIKALTRSSLKELTQEDSGIIFNQFAEILRHNVVSDKPNAFNKIFNLFLCKVVDEDRSPNEELHFQWLDNDTDTSLQKRLSDLYKQGMREYLTKEITDYSEEQLNEKILTLDEKSKEYIKDMFTRIRLHKNNEFAFKEVFDEKSFDENAVVVREVVELLQPFQIRYGHKQQFLGDFFELLLSTGIKQEAGQFFTPVPIAKFIISSIPLRESISEKIAQNETNFLPYIIDYSAGSGHFLTESMDEVQYIIESIEDSNYRPSVKSKLTSWKSSPFEWAYEYVYGIEADYRLVKTAKVSCFLNGDGLANVIHADGLDSFSESTEYKGKLKIVDREEPKDNLQFDVVVANPPYAVSSFKNTVKHGDSSFSLFERLTEDSSEIECLFVERTKQLLKEGGRAGIILPNSFIDKSGVSSGARDILFKNFKIRAIVELGTNTFMATGTKTTIFFLEKRNRSEWEVLTKHIDNFVSKAVDVSIGDVNNVITAYAEEVFESSLDDYHSFINRNTTDSIESSELFDSYKIWFNSLREVVALAEDDDFKSLEEAVREKHLHDLFFDKVIPIEKEKLLYYLLTYSQDTVLVKTNVGEGLTKEEKKIEAEEEKKFIGYDFSGRRGHEGIRMHSDSSGKHTTSLYDKDDHENLEKVNSYIYKAFLEQIPEVDRSLAKNLKVIKLSGLLDFRAVTFTNEISISPKTAKKEIKKDEIDLRFSELTEKYENISLSKLIKLQNGKGLPKSKMLKGQCSVYGGNGITGTHNEFICEHQTIAIGRVGAYCGAIHLTKEKSWITDNSMFVKSFDDSLDLNYLYFALRNLNLNQFASQSSHPNIKQPTVLSKLIPVPKSKKEQQDIVSELQKIMPKTK